MREKTDTILICSFLRVFDLCSSAENVGQILALVDGIIVIIGQIITELSDLAGTVIITGQTAVTVNYTPMNLLERGCW